MVNSDGIHKVFKKRIVMNKKGNWSHIQKMKGHKSGLETRIDEQLKAQGIDGEYEKHEVSYTIGDNASNLFGLFRLAS